METKAKFFFLMLMIIFFMGVLIHFLIPLQFVVLGTRKIEQTYNGYKIEVEQNTVRALAYLNSKVVSNQIQIYENVRSTVIRLFETGNDYETIKSQKIYLNSAYRIANMNESELESANMIASMWFIPNVTTLDNLNPTQQWVMNEYCQIQVYLESMKILSEFYKGLNAIEIYINIGQEFYFEYPSRVYQKFKDSLSPILNDYISNTILNFKTQGRIQTIFVDQQTIKACSPILDGTEPFAVVCLNLDVRTVTEKITQSLQVPTFEMSTNQYYFIRPLYNFENLKRPQIISYFGGYNFSDIKVPKKAYFQQLSEQKMAQLFTPDNNYLLNVMQLQKTKTYYTIPIETYNNLDSKQICMYLVVINTFKQSDLKSQSRYQQFFVVMIVPSTILLIISALIMGFIMKPIFSRLQQSSELMNDYCHYIRKNDMNLQITEVGDTSDIVQIFTQLKFFNLLNKLSTPAYLQVTDHQRIIRLLRALQLFDELGYSKVNIYQNLAQCYMRTGQYANAQRYLKMSVDTTIYELGGVDGITKMIKEENQIRRKHPSRKQQSQLKNLCYKLYKLCILLYKTRIGGDTYSAQQMSRNVNFLKKFDSKHSVCVQYVLCYLLQCISSLEDGVSKQILAEKVQTANQLVKMVESSKKPNQPIPIQILKSYFYYFKGRLLASQGNYFEGYQSFILALDGKCFDPDLHKKIKQQIQAIMNRYQINPIDVDHIFRYLHQSNNMPQKQFIFLSDVSNPNMNSAKFSKWKNKARKMAEYIFDNYINSKDRIGISQFCHDLKVVNNLIQKGTSESMLKKQLLSSIKARDQTIYSQLVPNLCKTLQRTKNLKKQKIYIFFLKEGQSGQSVEPEDILNQIQQVQNSTFIFLVEGHSKRIKDVSQGFYIIDFQDFVEVDIILGGKSIKRADNIIYLF